MCTNYRDNHLKWVIKIDFSKGLYRIVVIDDLMIITTIIITTRIIIIYLKWLHLCHTFID